MHSTATHVFGLALIWAAAIFSSTLVHAEDPLNPPADSAVLYLRDGDHLAGQLVDCADSDIVRWQMRGATRPYDLWAAAVKAIYFPAPSAAPVSSDDFTFELTDGDLLFGRLIDATPETFVFDADGIGELRIGHSEIRRISTAKHGSEFIYRGPSELASWNSSGPDHWREEAGRLISRHPHAKVDKELSIPELARVEFELAWNGKPEFEISLAAGNSDEQLKEGFRFEVWKNSLVAIRELRDYANADIVCELDAHESRVQLEALIDQQQGSMIVCGANGEQLAAIAVAAAPEGRSETLKHIAISSRTSEIRLERLAVSRWSGQLPPQVAAGQAGLLQTNGSVQYGDVIGYDPESRRFTLRSLEGLEGEEAGEISADEVTCIFPSPSAQSIGYACRLSFHDGSRISGELFKVEAGQVYLKRQGIKELIACPIDQLRSLTANHPVMQPPAATGRMGRLELEGVRLHGSLVEASTPNFGRETCLVWLPRWSSTDSPLASTVSGRIVYRDPPPKPKPAPRNQREMARIRRLQVQQARPAGVWGQVAKFLGSGNTRQPAPPKPIGNGTLHLLSGDRVPIDSADVDEDGVRLKSSVVDATFVPHAEVKALELMPKWSAAALAEAKRQRLLTLPRMQKPSPPTHLVASTGGDFLRLRLTSMTADTLYFESRLEAKQIPRDRVACIIWLHSDDPTVSDEIENKIDAQAADRIQVQAVRSDVSSLTFVPQECVQASLAGSSDLLGPCRVDLAEIDILNIGEAIEGAAQEQPYQSWTLADAIEPSYLAGDRGAGDGAAAGAGLIGKPAPDVRLKLLNGHEFTLADHKGHVVVLDFWASWCGPCMLSMPEVESVVEEFHSQGVRLVAVNMQEDPATIEGALDRLNIHPEVALDADGALAEHYQVTAIPQTVVIDSEGVITKLFVGAAPGLQGELRDVLRSLTSDADVE